MPSQCAPLQPQFRTLCEVECPTLVSVHTYALKLMVSANIISLRKVKCPGLDQVCTTSTLKLMVSANIISLHKVECPGYGQVFVHHLSLGAQALAYYFLSMRKNAQALPRVHHLIYGVILNITYVYTILIDIIIYQSCIITDIYIPNYQSNIQSRSSDHTFSVLKCTTLYVNAYTPQVSVRTYYLPQ